MMNNDKNKSDDKNDCNETKFDGKILHKPENQCFFKNQNENDNEIFLNPNNDIESNVDNNLLFICENENKNEKSNDYQNDVDEIVVVTVDNKVEENGTQNENNLNLTNDNEIVVNDIEAGAVDEKVEIINNSVSRNNELESIEFSKNDDQINNCSSKEKLGIVIKPISEIKNSLTIIIEEPINYENNETIGTETASTYGSTIAKLSLSQLSRSTVSYHSQRPISKLALNEENTSSYNFSDKPMTSNTSIICRICHNNDIAERMISPCCCKGTLAFVHRHCVEHWLSRAGILHCELCMHRFRTVHTLRYGLCESLRIWYRHPNNRGLLQADFLLCSLISLACFGLGSISVFSLQYFMAQSLRMGLSKIWTMGSITLFLIVVLLAYGVNLYFIVKGQVSPWFRWWRSARYVHIVLDGNEHVECDVENSINYTNQERNESTV